MHNCINYDLWGLNLAGIETQGDPDHKYKFNGIEKESALDLNVYTALFRTLDPVLGRWWQIDPKSEKHQSLTPYNLSFNNALRFSDPKGDDPPTLGANISLRYTFGSRGQSHVSLNASIGLSQRSGSSMYAVNVAGRLTTGGIGTYQGTAFARTGTTRADLVVSPSLTIGAGQGIATRNTTFSTLFSNSVQNTFHHPGTLGVNAVISSEAGRSQVVVGAFGKFGGDKTVGTYNDFLPVLRTDKGYTGGFSASITGASGGSIIASHDVYTGKDTGEHAGSARGHIWGQTAPEKALNSGQSSLIYTSPGNSSMIWSCFGGHEKCLT